MSLLVNDYPPTRDLTTHNAFKKGGVVGFRKKHVESFLSGYDQEKLSVFTSGKFSAQTLRQALESFTKIDPSISKMLAPKLLVAYKNGATNNDLIAMIINNTEYKEDFGSKIAQSDAFDLTSKLLKQEASKVAPTVVITPIPDATVDPSTIGTNVTQLEKSLSQLKQRQVEAQKVKLRAEINTSITEVSKLDATVKGYVSRLNAVKTQLTPLANSSTPEIKKQAQSLLTTANSYLTLLTNSITKLAASKSELTARLHNV